MWYLKYFETNDAYKEAVENQDFHLPYLAYNAEKGKVLEGKEMPQTPYFTYSANGVEKDGIFVTSWGGDYYYRNSSADCTIDGTQYYAYSYPSGNTMFFKQEFTNGESYSNIGYYNISDGEIEYDSAADNYYINLDAVAAGYAGTITINEGYVNEDCITDIYGDYLTRDTSEDFTSAGTNYLAYCAINDGNWYMYKAEGTPAGYYESVTLYYFSNNYSYSQAQEAGDLELYTTEWEETTIHEYDPSYSGPLEQTITLSSGTDIKVELPNDVVNIIFYENPYITKVYIPEFVTSEITDMSWMFGECYNLTEINTSEWDTSNVTNMADMFYECYNLTEINISDWDTSNVTDMHHMFAYCYSLTSLDVSNFDTSKVTDMHTMFNCCSGLTNLDVSKFNTSNVTDMSYMFYECGSLTSLDVSSFNTSNVTNMQSIFDCCYRLTSLDLSSFNTSNVTDMERMFYDCYSLSSLDVSNFDTSNVTNMAGMFAFCSNLGPLLTLSGFNTSNVTNMEGMFYNCSALTNIDLLSFNTSNVTSMYNMFYNCGKNESSLSVRYDSSIGSELTSLPTNNPSYIYFYDASPTPPAA